MDAEEDEDYGAKGEEAQAGKRKEPSALVGTSPEDRVGRVGAWWRCSGTMWMPDKSVLEVMQNRDKAASGDSDSDSDEEDAVDPEDVEDAAFPASIPLPPALDLSFIVDPDINIAAPALLDLVAPESAIDTSTIPKQTTSATPAAREDVQDVDWDW
ncbi:hypothetical protein B0H14DRAFT_3505808 [Mycena olivaceomarginata]|nr:hypothetical protein B0H14DRAFT_3505808 [Mycena olivaceomarginata]